jgi:ABC-2 type transport system ATP-binding protein
VTLLEVRDLSRSFGDTVALASVSFDVSAGEICGIIGPNGSGKTTLLETVCGLQSGEGGEVSWSGAPTPPARRKNVMFYVPDGIAPYPEHRVGAVIGFFARVFGRGESEWRAVVAALGLSGVLVKRVGALSKGFRRRLLLALGLIAPHPLLIMDEPFDGLDLRQTRDVMDLLRAAAREGRAILLSIHQLGDAERLCDRLVLLSGGRVAGEGTLAGLRARANLPHGNLEDIFLALS